MPASTYSKFNAGVSSDNIEYKDRFYHQALLLVMEGYNILIKNENDYSNEEEPHITGEIVRCARLYIEAPDSPAWVCHYTVHDDPPENDGQRKGKHRKRVDIIFEHTQQGEHPRIRFEAKRLKNPDFLVEKYIGEEGLCEFLEGNYAQNDSVAGMLGYAQSDNCDYWYIQIPEKLKSNKLQILLKDKDFWQKPDFKNIEHCYKTWHNRKNNLPEILIYHLLLDFTHV
ncbi:MAG: hypothetical protein NTZ07_04060 [Candidatus Woesebacteria bacterium]|nr:hypothetical protein [Candidatus Woesebacteria bacterium]